MVMAVFVFILKRMAISHIELKKLHQLVLDIAHVERDHYIPKTSERENVVEHSFSVAALSWRLFSELQPNLSLEKILKYCIAHDFLERGLDNDVTTYATNEQRASKAEYEAKALTELTNDFSDFPDMLAVIHDYESLADEEAKFVKTVDKMQAIILGEMDDWRPYKKIGVTHEQFVDKGESFMATCPDCLKDTLQEINEYSRTVFYDQPDT
jgi:5'-deoxynucleotidase YfbR-like HD superfamily hydrolase